MPKLARPKRRKARRVASNSRRRRVASRNPHRSRTVVIFPKANRGRRNRGGARRRSNPHFFGANVTAMKMAEYIAGGLIGMTVNAAVVPMLPDAVTSSNLFATLAAFGIALVEWWLGSMISKDFGSAVGFGALMSAGKQGLNAFLPVVGSRINLSGVGDLVPGRFAVPQNPILDAMTSMSNGGALGPAAYPTAYGRAA